MTELVGLHGSEVNPKYRRSAREQENSKEMHWEVDGNCFENLALQQAEGGDLRLDSKPDAFAGEMGAIDSKSGYKSGDSVYIDYILTGTAFCKPP